MEGGHCGHSKPLSSLAVVLVSPLQASRFEPYIKYTKLSSKTSVVTTYLMNFSTPTGQGPPGVIFQIILSQQPVYVYKQAMISPIQILLLVRPKKGAPNLFHQIPKFFSSLYCSWKFPILPFPLPNPLIHKINKSLSLTGFCQPVLHFRNTGQL